MSFTGPRLRADLVIVRQATADGEYFVVKDPVARRFFRFKEVEHCIAQLLDGTRSLEDVRLAVEERFDAPLEPGALEGFVAKLGEGGLLDTGKPPVAVERPAWNAKNPYSLRLRIYDPDRLLNRWVGALRFLYTPGFLLTALGLMIWAAALTFLDWPEIHRDIRHIGWVRGALIAWPLILLVGTAHEFAHGLTCKYFGGEVRDMGFMFFYFTPAMYCNVSDAWLFTERWKRLWVMFAGTFVELTLWASATIWWRFTDTGTFTNAIALVVMATSGVKTLLNFNPLLKLDGYYILSDCLGIPNLRRRSFQHIRGLVGLGPRDEAPTPRERLAFLLYGGIATVFTLSLLVFGTTRIGSFLMGRFQAWGLLVLGAVLPFMFRYRLRRLLPRPSAPAPIVAGIKALSAAPRRWVVGVLAVLATLVFGCMDLKITGEFTVLPAHNADVRSQVDGTVLEVRAREGDVVRRGQVLAYLSPRDYQAERDKVAADLRETSARLHLLTAGRNPQEIELARKELGTATIRRDQAAEQLELKRRVREQQLVQARGAVALTQERLRFATSNSERAQKLVDSLVISAKEYETVAEQLAVRQREWESAVAELRILEDDNLTLERRELAMAEGALREADQKLKLLSAGSRAEEIEATRAQVERLEAGGRYLEDQIRFTTLVSPIDGIVTSPDRALREMHGRMVHKGDLVLEVYELRSVTVEIGISEKEIGDIRPGQKVALKARAYPDRVFTGKVTAIATRVGGDPGAEAIVTNESKRPAAGQAGNVIVTTEIANPDLLLKTDMTGKAKIYCGRRSLIDLATRRLARAIRVEFWSWW